MIKVLFVGLLLVATTMFYLARPTNERPHRTVTAKIILPKIPGVINGNITQRNSSSTICMRGYTSTIRPSIAYTQRLKSKQVKALGYLDQNTKHYEEDHLIPLELGGDPKNPNNLWPEPWTQADRSDPLENTLHHRLCNNDITLAQAQSLILSFKFKRG